MYIADKDSTDRSRLLGLLNARLMTSCDKGGHRRFQAKSTGKWGYCTHDGIVVQAAQFDEASDYYPHEGVYRVTLAGQQKYYDKYWVEHSAEWVAYQGRFGA